METTPHLNVLVKYKALPDKSSEALKALKALIEEVKKEEHFVLLRLHIDPKDPSNILLYEEWDHEPYYLNAHMHTEHLKNFMVASRQFLSGPPEISFWKPEEIYE